ncbi:hypothetical protein DUZ99_11925 [Xylanibacillus composti]|uniref:Uncharacterized protein n=1 Tax=Xylanibacillus composti TaxID=1572762 RepID=A0A8J4H2J2_9BACL|nr:hypothetical protein [Xylanibacillus composti]MDT9725681.1 hypothetical protein [Xylanibacillus composti]GIQ67779.1 hypothetical protein XYCOK13_06030 [Xylanibacillus composti]
MAEEKGMNPYSGERVETDGIYMTEWGREELLKRGDVFPSDVMIGDTEWKLVSLPTDEEQQAINKNRGEKRGVRFHAKSGDR